MDVIAFAIISIVHQIALQLYQNCNLRLGLIIFLCLLIVVCNRYAQLKFNLWVTSSPDIRSIPIMFYALQSILLMFFVVLRIYYSFLNTTHQIDNKLIILFRIITFTVYTITTLVYIFIAQGLIYYKKLQTITITDFFCDDERALRITIAAAIDMLWNEFFAIFWLKNCAK